VGRTPDYALLSASWNALMHADFSVELGGDAPALEIPWRSDDPNVRYLDLKNHPELMQQISEAVAYPELGSFLARINAAEFPLATAKCNAWASSELAPEEKIFGDRKFVSYIDLIFVDEKGRCSFQKNEAFAKQLCRLLGYAPEIAATVELVIRHCYYHEDSSASDYSSASDNGSASDNSSESEISSTRKESAAIKENFASKDSARFKDSSEQSAAEQSPTEREHGMMPRVKEDTKNHRAEADLAPHDSHADIAEHADVAFHCPPMGVPSNDRYADAAPDDLHDQYAEAAPYEQSDLTNHESTRGFCMTAYVTGFGDKDHDPLCQWIIGLNLLLHAIVQLTNLKLQL
jgi:hypothetical protein